MGQHGWGLSIRAQGRGVRASIGLAPLMWLLLHPYYFKHPLSTCCGLMVGPFRISIIVDGAEVIEVQREELRKLREEEMAKT
jgi:hypothetical protein